MASFTPTQQECFDAARALIKDARYPEARAILEKIYQEKPDHDELTHLLGVARFYDGAQKAGVQLVEAVLKRIPNWADVHYNLGTMYQQMHTGRGGSDLAIRAFAQAYQLAMRRMDLLLNYGIELARDHQHALSESIFFEALYLASNDLEKSTAYSSLSYLYFQWGQRAALVCGENAVKYNAKDTTAWMNYGNALVMERQTEKSIEAFEAGLALDVASPSLKFNLGLAYLIKGDFVRAWPLYEARWQAITPSPIRQDLCVSEWRGEACSAAERALPLLIYCEQGFGDTIQFLRFVPMIAAYWGGPVWLEVQGECLDVLDKLWITRSALARLIVRGNSTAGAVRQCPLLSLPLVAQNIGLPSVPPDQLDLPYLHAPPIQKDAQNSKTRPQIALTWSGSATHSRDVFRSVPLEKLLKTLAPLSAQCDFVSVQKPVRPSDQPAWRPWLTPAPADLNTFYQTAQIVAHSDLVITVDTAVAHLAGAMGKKVFLMLPYAPDWRWGDPTLVPALARKSYWYREMVLFRAPEIGDWDSTLQSLRRALEAFVEDFAKGSVMPDQKLLMQTPTQTSAPTPIAAANSLSSKTQSAPLYSPQQDKAPQYVSGSETASEIFFEDALNQLLAQAQAAMGQSHFVEALAILQQGLAHPFTAHAVNWQLAHGNILLLLHRYDEAETALHRALALQANAQPAWLLLGQVFWAQRRYAKAQNAWMQAQSLAALDDNVAARLAESAFYAHDYAFAATQYELILKRTHLFTPEQCAKAWQSQGACYAFLNDLDAAKKCYQKALSIQPNYSRAQFNLAAAYLVKGDYAQAWPLYEARLLLDDGKKTPLDLPEWRGERNLAGQCLLIDAEQGLGDAVFAARFLSILLKQDITLVLWVPKSLRELFHYLNIAKALRARLHVVTTLEDALPFVPVARCPMMSLPYALKTTEETIPAAGGYLQMASSVETILGQKKSSAPKKRAALIWRGRAENKNDAIRSIPLSEWRDLVAALRSAHYECHSLNLDPSKDERALMTQWGIIDGTAGVDSVATMAQMISESALVITVDTLHAHLAGALGVRTWVLLPHFPDWRWQQNRNDSPWYRSLYLWRQSVQAQWAPVFTQIIDRIKQDSRKPSNAGSRKKK